MGRRRRARQGCVQADCCAKRRFARNQAGLSRAPELKQDRPTIPSKPSMDSPEPRSSALSWSPIERIFLCFGGLALVWQGMVLLGASFVWGQWLVVATLAAVATFGVRSVLRGEVRPLTPRFLLLLLLGLVCLAFHFFVHRYHNDDGVHLRRSIEMMMAPRRPIQELAADSSLVANHYHRFLHIYGLVRAAFAQMTGIPLSISWYALFPSLVLLSIPFVFDRFVQVFFRLRGGKALAVTAGAVLLLIFWSYRDSTSGSPGYWGIQSIFHGNQAYAVIGPPLFLLALYRSASACRWENTLGVVLLCALGASLSVGTSVSNLVALFVFYCAVRCGGSRSFWRPQVAEILPVLYLVAFGLVVASVSGKHDLGSFFPDPGIQWSSVLPFGVLGLQRDFSEFVLVWTNPQVYRFTYGVRFPSVMALGAFLWLAIWLKNQPFRHYTIGFWILLLFPFTGYLIAFAADHYEYNYRWIVWSYPIYAVVAWAIFSFGSLLRRRSLFLFWIFTIGVVLGFGPYDRFYFGQWSEIRFSAIKGYPGIDFRGWETDGRGFHPRWEGYWIEYGGERW